MSKAGRRSPQIQKEPSAPAPAPPPGSAPPPDGAPAPGAEARRGWGWGVVAFLWATAFGFLLLYELLGSALKAVQGRAN
jgi:hypothetical protein